MGQGAALLESTQGRLLEALKEFPLYLGILAWVDDRPAGIANCFFGFSTFKASRVLNIHDLAVLEEFRGRGVGRSLINYAVQKARMEKDRKSTRLNSSHVAISYAVFCLKKKKQITEKHICS